MERISSLQNPRVKHIVRLRHGHYRRRQNTFVVEGKEELQRLLQANRKIDELYVCEQFFRKNGEEEKLQEEFRSRGIQIIPMDEEAFSKCSYRENPEGLLALAPMWSLDLQSAQVSGNPLIVVLEKVEKPGNLGSIIRTADAAGADLIIMTESPIDYFNPNVIRNSRGALFTSQIVSTSNPEAYNWLMENEISIYTATPEQAECFWKSDFKKSTAIIVGNEKSGLSDFWLTEKPGVTRVKIPMKGIGDSLNVSVAGALVLYEVLRQRDEAK